MNSDLSLKIQIATAKIEMPTILDSLLQKSVVINPDTDPEILMETYGKKSNIKVSDYIDENTIWIT